MELNEWLTILGALGGFEAIKWTVNFYVHRHTNARKEDAAADAVEIQNLLTIIDSLNKQIERLEKDLVGRNSKVDFLYAELRKSEEKILEKRKARAEGLAEGRAEGRTEGQTITLIQQMKKKIQKSKTLIQIADELEEEPDTIQSLYECVSQNINLATEEIYKIYISPDKTED